LPKGKGLKKVRDDLKERKTGIDKLDDFKDRLLTGAAASAVDEVIDSPYVSAAEGALLGYTLAGPVGAVGGGIAGWILADERTVLPVDMVAIPAYQAYMIQGDPAFTVYMRAGETVVPTGGNVQDVNQAIMSNTVKPATRSKKRKKSGWHNYIAKPKNQIKHRSGPMKGRLNLKRMAKEYKRKTGKKGGRK
jgi:hypothetical protein|tara:strand:+ start:632 stop:1204 length:573 start_codon:yes stop_codon:yes gene_type:complete